jgi:hypothetical protein
LEEEAFFPPFLERDFLEGDFFKGTIGDFLRGLRERVRRRGAIFLIERGKRRRKKIVFL